MNRQFNSRPMRGGFVPKAMFAQRGFTLVELIAAFVIFVLGFGILLQMLAGSLHAARQAADFTQAALWAQSVLDAQGVGEPLKEGASSGRFDSTYSWQLNIAKFQPPPVAGSAPVAGNSANVVTAGDGALGQIELYQLVLVVNWGNAYLMHHARFVTLRVMGPPKAGLQKFGGG